MTSASSESASDTCAGLSGRKGSPEDGGKDTPGNHRLPVDQREGQLRLQDHGGGLDEMLSEPEGGHLES